MTSTSIPMDKYQIKQYLNNLYIITWAPNTTITRRIYELDNAIVSLENKYGKQSKFIIDIPIRYIEEFQGFYPQYKFIGERRLLTIMIATAPAATAKL